LEFSLAGANKQNLKSLKAPILLIGGQFDWLASPRSIEKFYRSLKIPKKVHMTINCTSHFIAFERRNQIMYKASSDWLQDEAISGKSQGSLTVKADGAFDWR
jgi:pimeloyl-ACP methyl ester carboxylesterase